MQNKNLLKIRAKSPLHQISTQTPKSTILAQHDLIFKPRTRLPHIHQTPSFHFTPKS